jgi:hypothetical protein
VFPAGKEVAQQRCELPVFRGVLQSRVCVDASCARGGVGGGVGGVAGGVAGGVVGVVGVVVGAWRSRSTGKRNMTLHPGLNYQVSSQVGARRT